MVTCRRERGWLTANRPMMKTFRLAGVARSFLRLFALVPLVIEAPVMAASLDLQEKCANQARKVLLQLRQDGEATYSRQNHYSEEIQKCFVWVGKRSSDN